MLLSDIEGNNDDNSRSRSRRRKQVLVTRQGVEIRMPMEGRKAERLVHLLGRLPPTLIILTARRSLQ